MPRPTNDGLEDGIAGAARETVLELLQDAVRGAQSLHLYDRGTLLLTNYRLLFVPLSPECPPTVIPLASIEKIQLLTSKQGRIEVLMLRVLGKTGLTLEVRMLPGNSAQEQTALR